VCWRVGRQGVHGSWAVLSGGHGVVAGMECWKVAKGNKIVLCNTWAVANINEPHRVQAEVGKGKAPGGEMEGLRCVAQWQSWQAVAS